MTTFSDVIAEVEADFKKLELWAEDEAATVARDLLSLGKTVAAAIEPAVFAALKDAVGLAVSTLESGASFGSVLTTVVGSLEPEAQVIIRSIESNLLNGVLSLLVAQAKPAPAAAAADAAAQA